MAINNLPDGLPPVLGEPQPLMKRYISEVWKDAESRFNLKLEFRQDPHLVLEVQRRDSPVLDCFVPELSNAQTHYSLIARRAGRPIATFGVAIFWLGGMDLVEYLEKVGFTPNSGGQYSFDRESAAFVLTKNAPPASRQISLMA